MALPVSDKGGGASFTPCPAGLQRLVCCDIVDHGMVPDSFGKTKHKGTIIWQSEHLIQPGDVDGDKKDLIGQPFIVQRRFTLSLHEKAELRKYLESWRGRPFSEAELARFDLDPDPPAKPTLIGANAYAQVMHLQKPRGLFAEVITIMPLAPGMDRLKVHPAYIRHKDRAAKAAEAAHAPAEPLDADDIPF